MDNKSDISESWNYVTSFNIVIGLGLALIILGIMRSLGVNIPSTLLMAVSVSSALLVVVDFIILNFNSEPTKIQILSIVILSFGSIVSVICIPYIPFVSKLNNEQISQLSDALSLMSFGVTISAIGIRGVQGLVFRLNRNTSSLEQAQAQIHDLERVIETLKTEMENSKELTEK
ncbi:hypothetical protein [Paenibacillus alvei]|uniref:Uncharacterized protein n=1 Tax=Paenibacillus alvei TaxID=44250 RepID=A0AAP7DJ01_PAEAL|nr:hypothetical protein [Paenibacillus alvei]NOJ71425.1 hypothetical protein [Paenibacillus alvei]